MALDYSTPFSRVVLDALRHASAIEARRQGISGRSQEPVPVGRVLDVVQNTLHGSQRWGRRERTGAVEERNRFMTLVSDVLEGAAEAPLRLIRRTEGPGDRPLYQISPRGEAIIDTGTELATVGPMLVAVDKLNKAWLETCDAVFEPGRRAPFPVGIYLLAVVMQQEVNRRLIESVVPEASRFGKERFTQPVIAADKRAVNAEFEQAVGRMLHQSENPVEAAPVFAEKLRANLSDHVKGVGTELFKGAHFLAVLRLYNAFAAWVDGEPLDTIITLLTRVEGLRGSFRSERPLGVSIPRSAEEMSWKTTFLARMLATTEAGDREFELPADEERRLHLFTLQLKHGCRPEAVPFFYSGQGRQRIPRSSARQWILKGLTPERVLTALNDTIPADARQGVPNLSDVRYSVRRYWLDALDGLVQEATEHKDDSAERRVAQALWTACRIGLHRSKYVPRTIPRVRPPVAERRSMLGVDRLFDALRNELSPETMESSADFGLHLAFGEAPGTLLWLDPNGREERDLVLQFVQCTPDWVFGRDGVQFDLAQLLRQESRHVVLVPVPWLPYTQNLPAPLRAAFEERSERGASCVVCTPVALAMMVTAVARVFLPSEEDAINALRSGGTPHPAEPFRFVDVPWVYDRHLTSASDLPSRLRYGLVNYFEPIPR